MSADFMTVDDSLKWADVWAHGFESDAVPGGDMALRVLACEVRRLRELTREAADELAWFLAEANNAGREGPPRTWRLVSALRAALPPNTSLSTPCKK